MRYTSWAQVVARYPSVARVAQAEVTAIESAFIGGAESELDARFAPRYVVPFCDTPTLAPGIVSDIATDLAYYKITFLRLEAPQAKALKDSIDERIKMIMDGTMSVVGSGGIVIAESAVPAAWSTHQSYKNITGVDDISDWAVSSMELIAKESDRSW